MNCSIKGLIPRSGDCLVVDLFGYSTRGLPGFEIAGISRHAKALKEKMIYLSRSGKIEIPPRRYLICVDSSEELTRVDQVKWLELPTLILYWSLIEAIEIKRLNGCVASGMVSILGEVTPLSFSSRWQGLLKGNTLIAKGEEPFYERLLPLEEIFKSRGEISFKSQVYG